MPLLRERDGAILTLRLDNPGRRNALDLELAEGLREACAQIREDRSVRCVIVTGSGDSFCSGADLGALRDAASGGVLGRRELLQRYYRAFLDVRDLEVPVVAAVNGPAVGAGLNLALAADIRVAGLSARLGATFARLGIHAGGGATSMLVHLVGPGHAAELLLGAELVDAERAERIGLVEHVVEDAAVLPTAQRIARSIALGEPRVVRMTKRALRIAAESSFEAVLELESLAQAAAQEAPAAAEGWAAFRERRPPAFPDA